MYRLMLTKMKYEQVKRAGMLLHSTLTNFADLRGSVFLHQEGTTDD
jgi:hypothetical protein